MSEIGSTTIGGDLPEVPETATNKRKRSSGGSKKKTGKAPDLSEKELKTSFYYMFRILGKVLNSKTEFDENEFQDLSKAYLNLANRFPPLKMFFLIMSPLATVGEFIEKFSKLMAGREKKPKQPKQTAPTITVVDPNAQLNEGVYNAINTSSYS